MYVLIIDNSFFYINSSKLIIKDLINLHLQINPLITFKIIKISSSDFLYSFNNDMNILHDYISKLIVLDFIKK